MNRIIVGIIVCASCAAGSADAQSFDKTSRRDVTSSGGQQSGTIYHFGSSASKQTIPAIPAPPPPAVQPPPHPPMMPSPPGRRLEPLGTPGIGHQQNKSER